MSTYHDHNASTPCPGCDSKDFKTGDALRERIGKNCADVMLNGLMCNEHERLLEDVRRFLNDAYAAGAAETRKCPEPPTIEIEEDEMGEKQRHAGDTRHRRSEASKIYLRGRIAELEEQLAVARRPLVEALRKYGDHLCTCAFTFASSETPFGSQACNCGFEAALREVEGGAVEGGEK